MGVTSVQRRIGSLAIEAPDAPLPGIMFAAPSPEYELLVDVVVPHVPARADLREWDGGRWGQTLNIADWHRLSPALYCHLRTEPGAPPAVLNALERAYLANAARSLFMRSATARVLEALEAAAIPAMLLKGTALVATVYDDAAQREMLDIDVLVPADRVPAAATALAELGYRPSATSDPAEEPAGVRVVPHHDDALVGPEQLVAVELHRHVAIAGEGRGFDIDGFWERSRTLAAPGQRVPSAEDLLLHVCFHFTRNRLGGSAKRRNTGGALAQIADIDHIVTNETIDWAALAATARAYGLGTRVFLGLFAAAELGSAIPGDALAMLEPSDFDVELGRSLVELRVLRAGDHLPVRSLRWMFAPSREALRRGWNADQTATLSLARAYMRRARAHVPEAGSVLRRPWIYVQDQRLNGRIEAMEQRG
jgi:hypothetical protein